VSGVVRDAASNPQVGVRVAAMAAPVTGEAKSADVLVSIEKTDEFGRYVLEIPPGRYYIIAGRVDRPTYYPDATNPDQAKIFSITSGSKAEGVDFKLLALAGVVRDAAGKPQAGVRVSAINANATAANGCRDAAMNEAETDSTGRYRLEVLAGEYTIVARLSDRTTFYPKAENKETSTPVAIRDGVSVPGLDIIVPVETVASGTIARDRVLYTRGLENTRIGCLSVARLLFQTLMSTYPDSEYASDAWYEMAESFYREGSPAALADARRLFEEYIRFFPNASRLSEARQRLLEIEQKR
jgi:TolA-binding protein